MPFRLIRFAGVELSAHLDDGFRSSRLWLWFLKPLSYGAMRVGAFVQGIRESLRRPVAATATSPVYQLADPQLQRILDEINQVEWYHSIPLSDGVVTPGSYDHRPCVPHYPIPESLEGLRVLDAGTLDGFWAFEMERRGAHEVIALDVATIGDLDLPPRARQQLADATLNKRTGAGFEIAHRLKNSRVKRVTMSLYDLSREKLGRFDFVLCSDLLCLVSDPVAVLQNLRRVTQGQAVIVDRFNPYLPKYQLFYHGADEGCLWWSYSLTGLEKMVGDAGFSDVRLTGTFRFAPRGKRAWSSVATFLARGS